MLSLYLEDWDGMNGFPEVPEPERRVDAAGGDESLRRMGGDVRQLNNIGKG